MIKHNHLVKNIKIVSNRAGPRTVDPNSKFRTSPRTLPTSGRERSLGKYVEGAISMLVTQIRKLKSSYTIATQPGLRRAQQKLRM